MGKKRLVTIRGRSMSLSDWARELGVTRQRVHKVYRDGRLGEWIESERTTGRPSKQKAIAELLTTPRTTSEVCTLVGCTRATFYRYVKEHNIEKKDGKYVESN